MWQRPKDTAELAKEEMVACQPRDMAEDRKLASRMLEETAPESKGPGGGGVRTQQGIPKR